MLATREEGVDPNHRTAKKPGILPFYCSMPWLAGPGIEPWTAVQPFRHNLSAKPRLTLVKAEPMRSHSPSSHASPKPYSHLFDLGRLYLFKK
jgi:hypothetical protein